MQESSFFVHEANLTTSRNEDATPVAFDSPFKWNWNTDCSYKILIFTYQLSVAAFFKQIFCLLGSVIAVAIGAGK